MKGRKEIQTPRSPTNYSWRNWISTFLPPTSARLKYTHEGPFNWMKAESISKCARCHGYFTMLRRAREEKELGAQRSMRGTREKARSLSVFYASTQPYIKVVSSVIPRTVISSVKNRWQKWTISPCDWSLSSRILGAVLFPGSERRKHTKNFSPRKKKREGGRKLSSKILVYRKRPNPLGEIWSLLLLRERKGQRKEGDKEEKS